MAPLRPKQIGSCSNSVIEYNLFSIHNIDYRHSFGDLNQIGINGRTQPDPIMLL